MTLYRLLTGPDTAEFCHKVSLALSKGWALHGSPAYRLRRRDRPDALRPGRHQGGRHALQSRHEAGRAMSKT
jgi:hypothetical protein